MSEPWEDFSGSAVAETEAGPWSEFSADEGEPWKDFSPAVSNPKGLTAAQINPWAAPQPAGPIPDSLSPSLIGGQPNFVSESPALPATPREAALQSRDRRGPELGELPADFVAEEISDQQEQPGAFSRLNSSLSGAPISIGTFGRENGQVTSPMSASQRAQALAAGGGKAPIGVPTVASLLISSLPQGKVKDLSAGAYNAAANVFNFFLSPAGVATLGIGGLPVAAQRTISAKFAYDMAMSAPEQLGAGDEAFKRGDMQAATEHWLGGAASLGFAGMAGRHAVEPVVKLPAMEGGVENRSFGKEFEPTRVPDTQLQPGVPREGISAEIKPPTTGEAGAAQAKAEALKEGVDWVSATEEAAAPTTVPARGNFPARSQAGDLGEQAGAPTLGDIRTQRATEARKAKPPTVQSVLDMTPEQYFEASSKWASDAISGDGINVQVRAELAAQANPNLKVWQDAQAKASADFGEIRDEVSKKPALMSSPEFQKRFTGAAQRASFFSEGRAILDGSKQPNARTVELSRNAPKETATATGEPAPISGGTTPAAVASELGLKYDGNVLGKREQFTIQDGPAKHVQFTVPQGATRQQIIDKMAASMERFEGTAPLGEGAASGFFPRQSEAQGLGEQTGAPNLEQIRAHRAQEALESKASVNAPKVEAGENISSPAVSEKPKYENKGVGSPADEYGAIYGPSLSRDQISRFKEQEGHSFPLESSPGTTTTIKVKPSMIWIETDRKIGNSVEHEVGVAYLKIRSDGTTVLDASKHGRPIDKQAADALMGFLQKTTSGERQATRTPPRELSDWTSATEDVAEAPAAATAATPGQPAKPEIIEMGAGIPIPKFADRKMSPLDRVTTSHSGKLQKSFSESRTAQKDIQKAVPSEQRRSAISIWREANGDLPTLKSWAAAAKGKVFKQAAIDAQSLTPAEIATANKTIAAFSALETRGNTYDVLGSHRDNYVPHVWDVKQPGTGFGTGMLKKRFRFAKARTFNTFFEGDQAGFKPKTLDISKLLPAYIHEMNRVIADRQAVRDLAKGTMPDGSPMVVPKGNVKVVNGPSGKAVLVSPKAMRVADTSDYRVMENQPALSNWLWEGKDTDGKPIFVNADLAVHPDVYRRLTAMMGQSALRQWYRDPVTGGAQIPRAIVRGLDTSQSAMKREMFGLLAPFHQVQEGTHAIGHLVNPFFGLEKVDLVKNAGMADAAKHGLMLLPDRASSQVYLEGVGTRSSFLSQALRKSGKFTKGAGEAIADVIDGYQDYLFHQYIPALKYKTYEAMVARNTRLYAKELASGEMTPADVKLTSAEQSNAAYGHLNYALLDRNPTIQHILQLSLLAPDFLEARARFVGQGVKGMRSKVGHEQMKAIAILAAAQAGSAFVLSQLLGVPYDEEHPFEVIYKGRRYTMRSVPEDIFGLMKDTRQFAYSRVNPLTVKGPVQLATGLNYRGEKVTATETMTELLAGYIPLTARSIPGLRDLTESGKRSPVTPLQQLAGSLGLRISRYSPISETYKLAGDWMEKQKLPKDRGSYPVSKYQQLRYALEDGDLDRAAGAYNELIKTEDPSKIIQGFQASVNHPFTQSRAMDEQFSQTLKGYDKERYEQALRTRQNILGAFDEMRRKLP